jgi:hypothetical protein
LAEPLGICGGAQLTPGEAPVEFGVDQGQHVDAVDEQLAAAIEKPRRVDLQARDVAATDHHARQVAVVEP